MHRLFGFEKEVFMRRGLAILLLIVNPLILAFPESIATILLFNAKLVLPFVRGAPGVLNWVVPFLPLVIYAAVAPFIRKYLTVVMDLQSQARLDNCMPWSLALSAVAFTAISLVVTFFKDEIRGNGTQYVTVTVFCFSVALVCFITSFMVLRFRGEYFWNYLWEGLTDNGLWCILIGLFAFFTNRPALHPARLVLGGMAAAYVAYLAFNFNRYFKAARMIKAGDSGDRNSSHVQ